MWITSSVGSFGNLSCASAVGAKRKRPPADRQEALTTSEDTTIILRQRR